MIEASAPSKVIIVGEHFVVKGQPAIAAALDVRSKARIEENLKGIIIRSINLNFEVMIPMELSGSLPKEVEPFRRILKTMSERYGKLRPAKITLESEIPVGSGMGSSASTFAAFTAAYSRYLGVELSLDEVNEIVYEAECVVHSKPSGIDNTIVTYGGVIAYRKGEGFLRLNVKINQDYAWLVADTGVRRSTGDLVRRVLDLYDKYEEVLMPLYHAAGHLAIEAAKALEQGDYEKLGELMNINQGMLEAIGVSTLQISEIVYKAKEAGALGAKLTGAGGGGAVLILAKRGDLNEVEEAIKPYTAKIFKTRITHTGIRVKEFNER